MAEYIYLLYIFFIHSSVYVHLCCSHILAIANSAINIGVHVSLWIMMLHMPSSRIAGLYNNYIFIFIFLTSIVFSIVAASVYIPTNHVGSFPFLHTLETFAICRLFNVCSSDWCKVIVGLICVSLIISSFVQLFMCLLTTVMLYFILFAQENIF